MKTDINTVKTTVNNKCTVVRFNHLHSCFLNNCDIIAIVMATKMLYLPMPSHNLQFDFLSPYCPPLLNSA